MFYVGSWENLIKGVKARERQLPPDIRRRLIGLVFAPEYLLETKQQLIPALNYWNARSGKHIDFFWPGYVVGANHEEPASDLDFIAVSATASIGSPISQRRMNEGGPSAFFDDEVFETFVRDFEAAAYGETHNMEITHIPYVPHLEANRYLGGVDLLILSATDGELELDNGVLIHLLHLNQLADGLRIHELFEQIFYHAEYQDTSGPLQAIIQDLDLTFTSADEFPELHVALSALLSVGSNAATIASFLL